MSSDIPLTADQKAMFSELGLQRDATNPQDTKQLITILTQYLHYPSDRLAKIHREASRLGVYDQISKRKQMKEEFKKTGANFSICECCCCIQQDKIQFTTEIEEIETVSESIVLFFSDMRYLVVWCFLSFLVFGIFAISTNVLSYDKYPEPDIQKCIRSMCVFHLISLGSKLSFNQTEKANRMYIWETWMRVLLVVVWIVFFIIKSKQQRSISVEQQLRNVTASDFAILIKDLPIEYDQDSLQQKLDKYANDVSHKFKGRFLQQGDPYDMKLKIVDFNEAEPYYALVKAMNQHKQSEGQKFLEERRNFLKEWICFRQNNKEFPVQLAEREAVYCEIEAKQLEITEQLKQLQLSAHQSMKQIQMQTQKRSVIVSFHHNYAKINMIDLNYLPWYSKVFKCIRHVPYTLNIPGIKIEPAPEPEDIVWENVGVPLKINILRSLMTYFATFLILAFSCAGLYVLSLFQSNTDQWYVSIFISIFISVINFLLIQIVYQLSWYEKDSTNTDFEVSVAHKAIIAQLINSVILNIFINIMTKKHFEKGGLAEDVFFLSLTSAFLPPITRALGAGDLWRFGRRFWYSFARNKLDFQNQRQYNLIWQKAEYEIGYNYVYTVKTILFTAFFLSLQPIISLISCMGIIMMYYSEKYYLFYRSLKPKPRSITVNMEMGSIMRLSVAFFALGNLLFSRIIPQTYIPPKSNVLDYMNLCLGVILYLIPLTIILKSLSQIPELTGLSYQNQKLFLTSEYERINPLTRENGIRNFGEYIGSLRVKYNKDFPQLISQIMDLNKDNPMQTISKMKAGVKVHRSRYRKGSVSFVSQDAKSGIKQQSQMIQFRSRKGSYTPEISLQRDGKIEAPPSEAVKMSRVRDQSQILDNSLLIDVIKPLQAQDIEKPPIKQFNILSFIQQIIDQEEDAEISLKKQYSLPVKSMRSINKFAQKYKQSND